MKVGNKAVNWELEGENKQVKWKVGNKGKRQDLRVANKQVKWTCERKQQRLGTGSGE